MMHDGEVIADVHRHQFAAGSGYLNTAAVGLPPRRAMTVIRRHLEDWEAGRCDPYAFDVDVDRARTAFARLVGCRSDHVAIISAVSVASGLVASSLPDGARVLCAEEDFTSVLFPFLVDDRLEVVTVPLDRLLDSVDHNIDLVAVSAVQSADGRVLDLDALASTADEYGARTYVDVTQAAGWLPVETERFDVTACGGYKWLCAPRGTGFLTVADRCDWLVPRLAGWYAGDDPWTSIYRPPLRLAPDTRRYNLSPPWFDIAAAAESLEVLAVIGVADIGCYSIELANRFRSGLDLPPGNSAIVAVNTDRGDHLTKAAIAASSRAGKVRLSFYLYNSEDDADRAADILAGRSG
jgi:selenocysteine lyase/cysteine desulfurase